MPSQRPRAARRSTASRTGYVYRPTSLVPQLARRRATEYITVPAAVIPPPAVSPPLPDRIPRAVRAALVR